MLVNMHGPFTWGGDPMDAVHNSAFLKKHKNLSTIQLNPGIEQMDQTLLNKHFLRKHGANAYYGQG